MGTVSKNKFGNLVNCSGVLFSSYSFYEYQEPEINCKRCGAPKRKYSDCEYCVSHKQIIKFNTCGE